MIKKTILLVISLFMSLNVFASGSTVGNGGDPLFSFLEDTRFIINRLVYEFGDQEVQKEICNGLESLSALQKSLCKEFILATRQEIKSLNTGKDKIKFIISKEPLFVVDSSGRRVPVAARTISGPNGAVEFHRGTLLTLSPFNLALLMVHEFGHKVSYKREYILDDKTYGAFLTGRELLDSVGKAYALYAKRKNYIGSYFGVNDYFSCETRFPESVLRPRPHRGRSPRIYYSNDYKVYQSGIGRNDDDFQVSEYDSNFNLISFKITIDEQFACGQVGEESSKTKLEIIKTPPLNEEGKQPSVEVLNSFEFIGNPLCSESPVPMILGVSGLEFSCEYKYSKGVSHNNAGITAIEKFYNERSNQNRPGTF